MEASQLFRFSSRTSIRRTHGGRSKPAHAPFSEPRPCSTNSDQFLVVSQGHPVMDGRSGAGKGAGDRPCRLATCVLYHVGAGQLADPVVSFFCCSV